LAHVLAQAVQRSIDPFVQLGTGPAVDDGFYYDMLFSEEIVFGEDQLKPLQKIMEGVVKEWQWFASYTAKNIDDAKQLVTVMWQKFKIELLDKFFAKNNDAVYTFWYNYVDAQMLPRLEKTCKPEYVEYYKIITDYLTVLDPSLCSGWQERFVTFIDLCEGGHCETMKDISDGSFMLEKVAGAYRQAKDTNPMMTRIYGLAFADKTALKEHIAMMEEAKKRDHRKLGKDLELFMISDEVGTWLPLYLPNGAAIRQLLEKYCYQEAKKAGYQYVYTPHIGKSDLFARSGHLDHYADGMYAPIDMVNLKGQGSEPNGKTEKFYLKPMNCPMHHYIYLNKPRSYRDLPYRLYEYGTVYRYEDSGALTWLIRVRWFTQNDAHVYCQRSQLKDVISEALNRFLKAYHDIGIKDYTMRFSLPDFVNDAEKYGEETPERIESVNTMRQVLDELGVNYYDAIGEAAFYGPKIDIQVKNVNGKEDSLSTIQVDYSIAPKFGIIFKNDKGEDEIPAIIHMALMGSVDRFMAFMLEMTAGKLPFWLSPTQIKILTINDEAETMNYINTIKELLDNVVIMKPLKYNELRYSIDDRSESLSKKIREATLEKIPVQLIIGPKDVTSQSVSIRTASGEFEIKLTELQNFLYTFAWEERK